jgi:hypothetical protein
MEKYATCHMAHMVMSKLNVIAPMKLRRTERSFRKWSDYHRKLPAYINLYTTSFEFCDVRKCDPNDRTNDKQISNALAKIHKSRGDLARVKTVNVVKNRWLPSLRSAAKRFKYFESEWESIKKLGSSNNAILSLTIQYSHSVQVYRRRIID